MEVGKGFGIVTVEDDSLKRKQEESNDSLRQIFLDTINLCWLHASDEVIKKANSFLESVQINSQTKDKCDVVFGELVVAMRNDIFSKTLFKRTELKGEDYKFLTVAKKSTKNK
jgi:hypothetical protein